MKNPRSSNRTSEGDRHAVDLTRPAIVLLLAILLVAFVIVFSRQQQVRRADLARQSELSAQLESVQRESASIESQLSQTDSDRYYEEMAREQLGMIRPGEILFETAETAAESSTASAGRPAG